MRKLAIAAFSFSAAIFAAYYLFTRDTALYAALFFALAGAAVLGVRLKSLKGLVITAFAASLGFAVFAGHYDLTVSKAHELAGKTRSYTFSLLESPNRYDRYTSVHARLESEGHPRLKCVLYATDDNMDALAGGDLITAELSLSPADIRYGVHTSRYNAKDIYLTGTVKDEIRQIGRRHSVSSLSSAAADGIARRMDDLFGDGAAPFIKALIIGDKSDLYDDDALYVALSRAGLMHVAAVSGMHVSFLIAFLRFLFGKGKRSAIACILLAWAFVAVGGMSPSAARAAFMQTMLLLAPLFERENDPVTSLSAALAVLLLVNPFAAANISLQLSFSAMLGIVLLFERLQDLLMKPFGDGRTAKVMSYPIGILSCTLSVMVFSLPLTAYYFGYVSVLSPLTNLLCLWAVPICFIGAFAALCFSWVGVLGKLIVFIVTRLVRYILAVCRFIASLDSFVVYLPEWLTILWAILFYLSIAVVFLFKLKPKYRLLVPLATAILGLFLPQFVLRCHYASAKETITAIDVGQGQCVSVMSGDSTVVIDCGSTSYAEYDAGDCAAAYLKSCGADRIDALVFTHLHADHANGYRRISNLMEIDKVLIPAGVDRFDPLLWEILSCADRHGTEVEFLSRDTMERFGEIRLFLFAEDMKGDANERCMPLIVSVDNYDVLITGDAPASKEKELVEKTELSSIEALVVGHHGSKSASCEEYLSALAGGKAIISVGKNNYGMPAAEVLERLETFGYTVYRTDLDGSVEIRVDG
ncbi:MAG: DNA internalization-related competence protein ComEC/Rec2 [Oscillospiraceae bacterium]|nr:DNA internalization-related competence protein ComEC/Rec2 [Oscillospiraceae bacterium]